MNLKTTIKYTALVATGLVAATVLAACSSSSSSSSASSSAEDSKQTVVKVATNASPKPFNYEDEKGELTGYEIETIRAIFKDSEKYKVEFEKTEWSGIFAGLDSDRYQLAVNNISYNDERAGKYLYAAPIAKNPNVLIVPKDSSIKSLDDIGGKSTEIVQGTSTASQLEKYNEEHADNPTVLNYTKADFTQILTHLSEGQFDYKLFDRISTEKVIKDKGLDNLTLIDLPSSQQPYVYPLLAQDQKELQEFVNKRIKELYADGTLEKLSQEFFGGSYLPDEADINK